MSTPPLSCDKRASARGHARLQLDRSQYARGGGYGVVQGIGLHNYGKWSVCCRCRKKLAPAQVTSEGRRRVRVIEYAGGGTDPPREHSHHLEPLAFNPILDKPAFWSIPRHQPASTTATYQAVKTARAPNRPMQIPKIKLRFCVISPLSRRNEVPPTESGSSEGGSGPLSYRNSPSGPPGMLVN